MLIQGSDPILQRAPSGADRSAHAAVARAAFGDRPPTSCTSSMSSSTPPGATTLCVTPPRRTTSPRCRRTWSHPWRLHRCGWWLPRALRRPDRGPLNSGPTALSGSRRPTARAAADSRVPGTAAIPRCGSRWRWSRAQETEPAARRRPGRTLRPAQPGLLGLHSTPSLETLAAAPQLARASTCARRARARQSWVQTALPTPPVHHEHRVNCHLAPAPQRQFHSSPRRGVIETGSSPVVYGLNDGGSSCTGSTEHSQGAAA